MEVTDFHCQMLLHIFRGQKLMEKMPSLSEGVSFECCIVQPSNSLRNGQPCKEMIFTSPFVSQLENKFRSQARIICYIRCILYIITFIILLITSTIY